MIDRFQLGGLIYRYGQCVADAESRIATAAHKLVMEKAHAAWYEALREVYAALPASGVTETTEPLPQKPF